MIEIFANSATAPHEDMQAFRNAYDVACIDAEPGSRWDVEDLDLMVLHVEELVGILSNREVRKIF